MRVKPLQQVCVCVTESCARTKLVLRKKSPPETEGEIANRAEETGRKDLERFGDWYSGLVLRWEKELDFFYFEVAVTDCISPIRTNDGETDPH